MVAAAAESQRLYVLAVDDPSAASAYGAGTLRRGGVTVAVSTDGRAPALAGLVREGLDALLPEDLSEWSAEAQRQRAVWRSAGTPMAQRRPMLLEALNRLYAARDAEGGGMTAQAATVGRVTLVGAGPGQRRSDHDARRAAAGRGRPGPLRRARLRRDARLRAERALVLRRQARLPAVDRAGRPQPAPDPLRAPRAARRAAQVWRPVRLRARRRGSAGAGPRRDPVRDRPGPVDRGGRARAGRHPRHPPRAGVELSGRHRPPRGDLRPDPRSAGRPTA